MGLIRKYQKKQIYVWLSKQKHRGICFFRIRLWFFNPCCCVVLKAKGLAPQSHAFMANCKCQVRPADKAKVLGSHFAIDLFKQQEIDPDEGMDLHAGPLTCLLNFKRLSDTI